MNKQQQLTKQAIKNGIMALVVALVFGAGYYGADQFSESALASKTAAENDLSADTAKMASYTSQIDKSGDAVKRFIAIEKTRDNIDFTAEIDTLSKWFRQAKDQYRFSDALAITITPAKPSEKSELQTLDYNVTLRPDMEIKNIEAMSDIHVLSFLQEFMRHANGLVNVTHFALTRKGEMDASAIAQMRTRGRPVLVQGEVKFDWIGVARKEKTAPATSPASATPSPGGIPPAGGTP
ncbi:MAG: hypothetical protein ACKVOE_05070 [Rickettsiales bacterium]